MYKRQVERIVFQDRIFSYSVTGFVAAKMCIRDRLEAYEEFSKNEQSIEELMKQVEKDCGIRFTEDKMAEEKK